jgi:hypothetical protein
MWHKLCGGINHKNEGHTGDLSVYIALNNQNGTKYEWVRR